MLASSINQTNYKSAPHMRFSHFFAALNIVTRFLQVLLVFAIFNVFVEIRCLY